MDALRGAGALDQARMARQLSRPEADLVPSAPRRPRQRRVPARKRPSRVRRVALARLLDSTRHRDRLQARGVSPGLDRARALLAPSPADPEGAAVRLGTRGRSLALRQALRRGLRRARAGARCRPRLATPRPGQWNRSIPPMYMAPPPITL